MMKIKLFFLFSFIFFNCFSQERGAIKADRYELLSGVHKSKDPKGFWDKKYARTKYIFGKTPASFLAKNYDYLPANGKVLDMGMGEGRNAVFLARKGFKVTGVDISSVAIKKANLLAKEFGVRINSIVASMNHYKIPKESYDAIVCFYYVDRSLHDQMVSWLKPGGILIYESHTDLQKTVKGSENYEDRYLLRESELLTMFNGMRVLKYEEPLHQNEYTASIILQKPEKLEGKPRN